MRMTLTLNELFTPSDDKKQLTNTHIRKEFHPTLLRIFYSVLRHTLKSQPKSLVSCHLANVFTNHTQDDGLDRMGDK